MPDAVALVCVAACGVLGLMIAWLGEKGADRMLRRDDEWRRARRPRQMRPTDEGEQ